MLGIDVHGSVKIRNTAQNILKNAWSNEKLGWREETFQYFPVQMLGLGFLLNANLQFHVFLVYLKCKRDSSGFQMSGTKQINFCQCIDKICISSYDIQIYLFICCLTLFSYTAIVPRSIKILYLPFFRFTGVGLKVKRLVQSLQSLGMDMYF